MTWLKIDDRFAEHPKLESISDAALRSHMSALCYAARNLTDGFLPERVMRRIATGEIVAEMVAAVLWEPSGESYAIHDYLEYNPSREQVLAERAATAERVRKSRDRSRTSDGNGVSNGVTPPVSNGVSNTPPVPVPVPQPLPLNEPLVKGGGSSNRSERKSVQALQTYVESETDSTSVGEVFEAWQLSVKQPRARLDTKRRVLIKRALAAYPVEDVIDAVRGWERSPHHRGENDRHTVYNNLSLLLRDAEHIERFRDLERGVRPPIRSTEPAVVALREARERLEAAAQ